jgi:hypothetical protein
MTGKSMSTGFIHPSVSTVNYPFPTAQVPGIKGQWTSLLVLVPGRRKDDRLDFIEKKLNEIKRNLQNPNADIGVIFIDLFSKEDSHKKFSVLRKLRLPKWGGAV